MDKLSKNSNTNVSRLERTIDQNVAREICSRLEFGGKQFQWGQYVAVLRGRVIAVGDNFDEVQRALTAQEPNPHKGLICQVDKPMPDVIR